MKWSEMHFVEYLKAVDAVLEETYGCASEMAELEPISMAHQENIPPEAIALRLREALRPHRRDT